MSMLILKFQFHGNIDIDRYFLESQSLSNLFRLTFILFVEVSQKYNKTLNSQTI